MKQKMDFVSCGMASDSKVKKMEYGQGDVIH